MASELRQEAEAFLQNAVMNAMEDYEIRHSQEEMLQACSDTITNGGVLIAEAGTGTGKTFAYLIPLILSGKKAIVSTRTKNLQEQLASKDLRFLSSLKGFDYAIAKGRGNYLCLRRLNSFIPANEEEATDHNTFLDWTSETESGDFEEFAIRRSSITDKICSDSDACRRTKCQHYRDCYYFKARRKWENAQIVVANHALLTINAMIEGDSKILPQAEVLVIDEGHALDNVLSNQIGINLSNRLLEYLISRLLRVDDRGIYKGLLSKSPNLFSKVESLKIEAGLFWVKAGEKLSQRLILRGEFILKDQILQLANSIKALMGDIRISTLGLFQEDEEIELKASLVKLGTFAEGLETFAEEMEGFVRWAEREDNRITLRMSPIYPRDFIRSNVVPEYRSIILTSATLSVSGNFGLTGKVLGLEDSEKRSFLSPFDMRNQVEIIIKRGIDLKSESGIEQLGRVIIAEALKKDGGVLVLFTSREAMSKTWSITSRELHNMGRYPMLQGELPNKKMLDLMREDVSCVLFGLDSFWEGVDIKGDYLKSLIITKLPFEVPSEPMVFARTDAIQREGGDPFNDYSLPKAILKFRQGFGRLIRSKNDTGRVTICDERIETKRYGRRFMGSII